ncbi:MAG: hypothetical protein LUF87_02175 [Alistipes sp.]|nr:hypothetical protein [Alistipes sp.]
MIFLLILIIAAIALLIIGNYNERKRVRKDEIRAREITKSAVKEIQRRQAEAQQLERDKAEYEEYIKWAKGGYGRFMPSSFEDWRMFRK